VPWLREKTFSESLWQNSLGNADNKLFEANSRRVRAVNINRVEGTELVSWFDFKERTNNFVRLPSSGGMDEVNRSLSNVKDVNFVNFPISGGRGELKELPPLRERKDNEVNDPKEEGRGPPKPLVFMKK
jgi:hypothetical protein